MNFAAPHVGFVIAAYAIAFVVISVMVIGTLVDYRSLKKSLERVETRTRRTQDSNS
ncbi:MAG TPA: heme exporter protein CcmD [Methylovirgula sp.]